jgi:NitT/TauT family transport system ATP-binding protein
VGAGAIVSPTTAIWPFSPEKVVGCRAEWAERNPEPLGALLRALHRAAAWCQRVENHGELARVLAEPRYVGASSELLQRTLTNRLTLVPGTAPVWLENFYLPGGHAANFPWVSHALWFYSQMVRWRQVDWSAAHLPAVRATYRPDLYRAALASLNLDLPRSDLKVEHFFDDRAFNPVEIAGYMAGLT